MRHDFVEKRSLLESMSKGVDDMDDALSPILRN